MQKMNEAVPMLCGEPVEQKVDCQIYSSNTEKAITVLLKATDELLKMHIQLENRHEALCDYVYSLYPDLDIIDSIAEDDEEREQLRDLYLAPNPNYIHEIDAYKKICEDLKTQYREEKGLDLPYDEIRDMAMQQMRMQ